MKRFFLVLLIFIFAIGCNALSCHNEDELNTTQNNNVAMANGKIKITVNDQHFSATLLENGTARAFKKMLPLTATMTELNGNEKYYDLPNNLPSTPHNPGTVNKGDLMLYGSKTLVLFYKTFSTPYSYTKLGMVDNITGLESALVDGSLEITFEGE